MASIKETGQSGPATEQSKEEIFLAGKLRGRLDQLLVGTNSRSFDFSGCTFYVKDPYSCIINQWTADGCPISGTREGQLLDSREWPTPKWTPTSASVSKNGERYCIEVKGYRGQDWNSHYGLRLTLQGTYPKIDKIVPESSPEAQSNEGRPWSHAYVPAIKGNLRPRLQRLRYGLFIAGRLEETINEVNVLSESYPL